MIIFVSDMFLNDYVGGAELTSEAVISKSKIPINKVRSNQLTKKIVDDYSDRHWIFGNFSGMSKEMILYCCKNLPTYSVIEYDYKYCKYRLPDKHIEAEGFCNCENEIQGKLTSIFYANSKKVWFMSEEQKKFCIDKLPALKSTETEVLSSVFSEITLDKISTIDITKKNDKWLIQDSPSWVKGTDQAIAYAKENNLDYELFSGMMYEDMLEKFGNSKGFIFLPNGSDTCPRTVIEAKLLGCELILNDSVQHKNEEWFKGDIATATEHLSTRAEFFWEETLRDTRIPIGKESQDETTHFKIIVPCYNAGDWIQNTLKSIADQEYSNFECVVVDDISNDSTWEKIESFNLDSRFVKVKNTEKKYALRNINDSIDLLAPSDGDVIILLDGDDWLSSNYSLCKLNEYYSDKEVWMTYGSFVRYPDGCIGQESSEYPKDIVDKNLFRSNTWRASHLKTFRNFLWQNIKKEDLKDEDGEFFETAYDQAIMLPLLEMSGDHSKYLEDVLCVYNVGNPNAVNKTRVQKQYKTMLRIREKEKYKRLKHENIA